MIVGLCHWWILKIIIIALTLLIMNIIKLIQIAFGLSFELMQSNEQWFVCWRVLQVFPNALE
jgi:hypothetical protein